MQLDFNVVGQVIERLDSNRVAANSQNWIVASFTFDDEWDGSPIKAIFTNGVLEDVAYLVNGECLIPALPMSVPGTMYVSTESGSRKTTVRAIVKIEQSGSVDVTPAPPTDQTQTYVMTYAGTNGVEFIRYNNLGQVEVYDGVIWTVIGNGILNLPTGFSISGGTIVKTLTVTSDADVSGTNTGDETNSSIITKIGFTPENVANKVTSISILSTDAQYPSAKLLYDLMLTKQPSGNYEVTSNKVTVLSSASTDVEYASAKVVYDGLLSKVDTVTGYSLIADADILRLANTSGTNTGDQDIDLELGIDRVTGDESKHLNERGDWILMEPPTGGYANNLYFGTTADPIISGYKILTYTPDVLETTYTNTVALADGEKLFQTYLYPMGVAVDLFPAGLWGFNFYGNVSATAGITQIGITYFKRSTLGVETDLFTAWSNEINNTTNTWIQWQITNPSYIVDPTDRMGARIKAKTTWSSTVTIEYKIGDGYGAYLNNPNKIRHSQLRDLNGDTNFLHVTSAEKSTWNDVTLKANITNPSFKSTVLSESPVLGAELADGTGWTLGTGWTGDFTTGFVHATGNTATLSRTMTSTGTKKYQIAFTISSPTSSYVCPVTIGNSLPFEIYVGGGTVTDYAFGIISVSNGDLVFTPETSFDGTITNISVKEITAIATPNVETKDSTDTVVLEERFSLNTLDNVFIGKTSGQYNTTGYNNVNIGSASGKLNTTGFWNVGVGKSTLETNSVGSRCVAIGFNALAKNISGHRNQAIGSFALQNNTIGTQNIAVGSDSLDHNTTGSYNVSTGFQSLYNNTIGNYNTSIGHKTMYVNTHGDYNIALGAFALAANSVGDYNIAIGAQAMTKATGSTNVAVGAFSLYQNATGTGNTVVGSYSAQGTAGNISYNTLLGESTGTKMTTGANGNTVLGYKAGSLATTGDSNILVGYKAGDILTTGARNIIIGYDIDTPLNSTNDYLNIGGTIFGDVSTKKIGVNVATPTASLHLPASTTSASSAPIKLNLGVLMTSPEAGAIEYDGTSLYYTGADSIRKSIRTNGSQIPVVTYVHSGNKSVTIAQNSDVDVANNKFISTAHGLITNDVIYIIPNDNIQNIYPPFYYPTPVTISSAGYTVTKINDNEFSLNGVTLTSNANLDVTKWHFENNATATVPITVPSASKYRIIIKGQTLRNGNTGYMMPNGITETDTNWAINGFTTWAAGGIGLTGGDIYVNLESIVDYTSVLTIRYKGMMTYSNNTTAFISTAIDRTLFNTKFRNGAITSLVFKTFLANGFTVEVYDL